MNQQREEKLREDWNNFVEALPSRVGETPKEVVFNWWLSRRSQELSQSLKELIENKGAMKQIGYIPEEELSQYKEGLLGEIDEPIIECCENCGGEGYGKAWYGKGKPNDPHGYGDAYYPTGSVVFCKECADDFKIGKELDGEKIWKRTSDDEQHKETRLNAIRRKKTIEEIKNIIKK